MLYNFHYYCAVLIMFAGLYIVVMDENYYRKLIGLSIFQSAIILFYVSTGYVEGGISPILRGDAEGVYANPLPQVLMLTAIVVGLATLSVGLVLVHRYYEVCESDS